MNRQLHKSLTACAAVLSLSALVLTGCGGSNLPRVATGQNGAGTPTPGSGATPTPVPTATPGTGTGTLADYFGTVSTNRTLTYRDTTTTTSTDFLTGQPTTTTDTNTYTTGDGGALFAFGDTGQKTQVTLATSTGNVTVTRQETLDDDGRVIGYNYYTLDSNAYTLYGSDTLDEQRRTTSTVRYAPAIRFALNLRVGQTATQTTRATQTSFDVTDNTSTQSFFDQTFTLTFVGIESVTVPAGTYASAARINFGYTFNSPAQNGNPAFGLTLSSVSWNARSVGMVKTTSDSRSTFDFENPTTGQTQTLETRSQSNTELISVTGG